MAESVPVRPEVPQKLALLPSIEGLPEHLCPVPQSRHHIAW